MPGALILIVEDNEKNQKLVRDVLGFNGYRTVSVDTAEEALQAAGSQQPALILMDLQLPGMNGITALSHLRANAATRKIPVIAMTASAMTFDKQKSIEAGFDGYQAKPIRIKEFVAEVQRVLDLGSAGARH